jgi:hypothetical protein
MSRSFQILFHNKNSMASTAKITLGHQRTQSGLGMLLTSAAMIHTKNSTLLDSAPFVFDEIELSRVEDCRCGMQTESSPTSYFAVYSMLIRAEPAEDTYAISAVARSAALKHWTIPM